MKIDVHDYAFAIFFFCYARNHKHFILLSSNIEITHCIIQIASLWIRRFHHLFSVIFIPFLCLYSWCSVTSWGSILYLRRFSKGLYISIDTCPFVRSQFGKYELSTTKIVLNDLLDHLGRHILDCFALVCNFWFIFSPFTYFAEV